MRDNYKYNGWCNYATWRVNLELIDENQNYWFSVIDDLKKESESITYIVRRKAEIINHLMDNIKDDVEDTILNNINTKKGDDISYNFAYNYALAFVSDVSYYEIAEALVDGHDIGKMFFKYKLERTSEE
jgi:hypothetical protein